MILLQNLLQICRCKYVGVCQREIYCKLAYNYLQQIMQQIVCGSLTLVIVVLHFRCGVRAYYGDTLKCPTAHNENTCVYVLTCCIAKVSR